ncbi:S-adenosyl-L-methionine-dependent methyltransferase [Zopfochytrium polystomum]|nr:S-adenosyl-L-methionine-dependent methyltransferase [Zopfochytrium polystomum]
MAEERPIRALEFFSGIGGLHYGLLFSQQPGASVVASFDINPVGNVVIAHNFGVAPIQKVVESLTAKQLDEYQVNCWLLSPPCQPYTRGGKKLDDQDLRARGLLHLVELLPQLANPPKYIFLENVLNFEVSRSRDLLLAQLHRLGYSFDEWMLTPTQFGIPNDRKRYYLTARREQRTLNSSSTDQDPVAPPPLALRSEWPAVLPQYGPPLPLNAYVEDTALVGGISPFLPVALERHKLGKNMEELSSANNNEDDDDQDVAEEPMVDEALRYKVPEAFLKSRKYISPGYVVSPTDTECPCFTKAYGHRGIGAGAFLQTKGFEAPRDLSNPLEAGEALGLRLFTPLEIARLHAFPIDDKSPRPTAPAPHPVRAFSFPPSLTLHQKYRLLGNSLNVKVVGELLRWVLFNKEWAGWLPKSQIV